MNILEGLLNNAIKLDPNNKIPMYGSDQIYIDYPSRFATVTFELAATDELVSIAEQEREEQGLPYGDHVRYSFYYSINGLDDGIGDNCITVITEDENADTADKIYINISEDEMPYLYKVIDKISRAELGKDINTMLKEAKTEMEKYND